MKMIFFHKFFFMLAQKKQAKNGEKTVFLHKKTSYFSSLDI